MNLRALALIVLVAAPASGLVWPDVPERIGRDLRSSDPSVRVSAAKDLASVGKARAVPLVLQAFGDSEVEVRVAAAQAAARLQLETVTDAALPWLSEPDPRLRAAACDLARAIPSAKAVNPLARALGDADASVRAAAADALGAQTQPEAVPPLLGRLDDSSPIVRGKVVRALSQLGDGRAVVPLIGKIQDSFPEVRQAIARALGELADQRAAQALILLLRDNVMAVRMEAVASLGRLRSREAIDSLAPLLFDRAPALRDSAARALGQIGSREAVRVLIRALGQGDDLVGDTEGSSVREALATIGSDAADDLVALLDGAPSPAVATSAVWILGALHFPSATPAIIRALRHGIVGPPAALHALGQSRSPDALAVVLEFLTDADASARAEARATAEQLLDPRKPDTRALEPLASAFQDTRLGKDERVALARLIGKTGSPKATRILAPLTKTRQSELRLAAVDGLGDLGSAEAEDALLPALSDEDASLRLHTAMSLAKSGGPKARDAILQALQSEGEIDRPAHLLALAGIVARHPSELAATRMEELLDFTAGGERDGILEVLGRNDQPQSLRTLERILAKGDPDDSRSIASVLAAKGPSASAMVRRLTFDNDESVRAQAVWTLGAVGDPSSFDKLTEFAKGRNLDTASNAVAALARIAARHGEQSAAARLLCPWVQDSRTVIRTNALAGLALSRARCGDGGWERNVLLHDGSEPARAAAARLLRTARLSAEDDAALVTCMASDRSSMVARQCRELAGTLNLRTRASTIYVVAQKGTAPQPRTPYVIMFANGLSRMGLADRRGAAFEALAPEGEVSLGRLR